MGKKIRIGDFYDYNPGGVVKIIHFEDGKIFGILFKYPEVTYNFEIDTKQLSTMITDPEQKKALDNRVARRPPILKNLLSTSLDLNLNPDV